MAKGQMRSNKEQRKQKSGDKKQKPARPHELIQSSKAGTPRPGQKS